MIGQQMAQDRKLAWSTQSGSRYREFWATGPATARLTNLVSNAIRLHVSGEVRLAVETAPE